MTRALVIETALQVAANQGLVLALGILGPSYVVAALHAPPAPTCATLEGKKEQTVSIVWCATALDKDGPYDEQAVLSGQAVSASVFERLYKVEQL